MSTATVSTSTQVTLSEEQIDDLLYLARANESSELLSELTAIKEAYMTARGVRPSEVDILLAAVDPVTGNNVLHMAAANGHTGVITSLLPLISPLSLAATVVCHKNASGNTPLHWACLNGHLDTVRVLVEQAGADPALVNAAGHDPVFEAEVGGKADVVEWLLRNCAALEEGSVGALDLEGVVGADADADVDVDVDASVDGGGSAGGSKKEGSEKRLLGEEVVEGDVKVNGEMERMNLG